MDEIVVSAPGKVLIAGGYLILDPAYPGLVISTTSKFYTVIRPLKPGSTGSAAAATATAAPPLVRVRSPQFINAEWRYDVQIGGGDAEVTVTPLESEGGCVDPCFIIYSKNLLISLSVLPRGCCVGRGGTMVTY